MKTTIITDHNLRSQLQDYAASLGRQIEICESGAQQNIIVFYRLLQEGKSRLLFTEKDAAHEFEVSRSTITRWVNAVNAPHPAMRVHVYVWLLKQTKLALEMS